MTDPWLEIIPAYDSDERELLALEESWADYHRGLRTGVRARVKSGAASFRGGSLVQVSAGLGVHREEFQAGDRAALIDALRLACDENVPLPYWLADGIRQALDYLHATPAETLHSVFDMQKRYPTSKKKAKKGRLDLETRRKLYMRASLLIARNKIDKGAAIKQAIKDLPIQFRTAFKWFNQMDAKQQTHLRAWRGVRLHKLR